MTLKYPQKWVIGLTGAMLSGKSTALDFFKQNGAYVLSADSIVAGLYECPAVRAKLVREMGTADKEKLAETVFNNAQKREKLENLLHPLVLKEMRRQIKSAEEKLIVCEIPLLFEANWDKYVDMTLVVCADKKTLAARLKERRVSRAQYLRRLENQISEQEKCKRADVVFFHATKTDLGLKVKRFYQAFDLLNNRSNHARKSNAGKKRKTC